VKSNRRISAIISQSIDFNSHLAVDRKCAIHSVAVKRHSDVAARVNRNQSALAADVAQRSIVSRAASIKPNFYISSAPPRRKPPPSIKNSPCPVQLTAHVSLSA
jgi:hypothetical protein